LPASEYLRVMRAHWLLIVATAIIVTVGTLVFSVYQPAQYQGQAVLLYSQRNQGAAILGVPQPQLSNFPELELATQASLIQQPQILQQVIRDLGLNITAPELLTLLTVSADGQTNVITISALDSTPRGAAAIAGAVARVYAVWSQGKNKRSIAAAAQTIQDSLSATKARLTELAAIVASDPSEANKAQLQAANTLYGVLAAQLQQLQSAEQLETGSVSIVTEGVQDPVRVEPNPLRNAALGLAIGLVLGLSMAFVANTLDSKIESPEEASALYGAPILGQIPFERARGRGPNDLSVIARPISAVAESYRDLRNGLQFINFEHSIKTLMVTSAVPSEGKSTVAANLAVVLAQAGSKVVLVIADFRRASVVDALGVAEAPGLSEVLCGTCELDAAVQRSAVGISVLSAGQMPPNPSELLGSVAMRKMLESLAESADFIILDTPPLLAVADAAAVARWTDGALVVVREGLTTRDAAREARKRLAVIGKEAIGIVVTGVPKSGVSRSSYYTYSGIAPK